MKHWSSSKSKQGDRSRREFVQSWRGELKSVGNQNETRKRPPLITPEAQKTPPLSFLRRLQEARCRWATVADFFSPWGVPPRWGTRSAHHVGSSLCRGSVANRESRAGSARRISPPGGVGGTSARQGARYLDTVTEKSRALCVGHALHVSPRRRSSVFRWNATFQCLDASSPISSLYILPNAIGQPRQFRGHSLQRGRQSSNSKGDWRSLLVIPNAKKHACLNSWPECLYRCTAHAWTRAGSSTQCTHQATVDRDVSEAVNWQYCMKWTRYCDLTVSGDCREMSACFNEPKLKFDFIFFLLRSSRVVD